MKQLRARVLTIGTEIVSGEIVNTNAAWVSQRLEERGVRVLSHLSVRDQRGEMLEAFQLSPADILIVTGGLGPTSDDITRNVVAEFCGAPLEFDEAVWKELAALYETRGLTLRQVHRQQCHFPKDSVRLKNPVGTALGFQVEYQGQRIFVLPGPPRELEGMWKSEVEPRLKTPLNPGEWIRWTCLGAPESEVAEAVDEALGGRAFEVGYRAQLPYVKVKIHADPKANGDVVRAIEGALGSWLVARGTTDLARELLAKWPLSSMRVHDTVCGGNLFQRLLEARSDKTIEFHTTAGLKGDGVEVTAFGETFQTRLRVNGKERVFHHALAFKLPLASERGRRSAAEWVIWHSLQGLSGPQ